MKSLLFLVGTIFIIKVSDVYASRPCFNEDDCLPESQNCNTLNKPYPVCIEGQCQCLDKPPECKSALDCDTQINCEATQDKYCHMRTCHCHLEVECTPENVASVCPCPGSACDNGHCHPVMC